MSIKPLPSTGDIVSLIVFLASFVLRGTLSYIEKRFPGGSQCSLHELGQGPRASAILANERGVTWREARARLDARSNLPLFALCFIRLVLWHWLQPISFCFIYNTWTYDLGSTFQQSLAIAGLLREALYFGCTLAALYSRPAFLLTDIGATWHGGARGEVIAYVLMPEKYLGWYLSDCQGSQRGFRVYCAIIVLLDLCSFIALCSSIFGSTDLPTPLALCYLVTSVSFLTLPFAFIFVVVLQRASCMPSSGSQTRQEDLNPLFEFALHS